MKPLFLFIFLALTLSATADGSDRESAFLYDTRQGMYLSPKQSLCGVMSLCGIFRKFGIDYEIEDVARMAKVDETGCSMADLARVAESKGMHVRAIYQKPREIRAYLKRNPGVAAILHMPHDDHFIAVLGFENGSYTVWNYARLFRDDLGKMDKGTRYAVLYLSPQEIPVSSHLAMWVCFAAPALIAGAFLFGRSRTHCRKAEPFPKRMEV